MRAFGERARRIAVMRGGGKGFGSRNWSGWQVRPNIPALSVTCVVSFPFTLRFSIFSARPELVEGLRILPVFTEPFDRLRASGSTVVGNVAFGLFPNRRCTERQGL